MALSCRPRWLAIQIHDRIKELGLIQAKAARLLGVSQPNVSRLMNMRSGRRVRPVVMRVLEGSGA